MEKWKKAIFGKCTYKLIYINFALNFIKLFLEIQRNGRRR